VVWTIRAFTSPETMKARDFLPGFFYLDWEGKGSSIGGLE
jgi:hypothetical protein